MHPGVYVLQALVDLNHVQLISFFTETAATDARKVIKITTSMVISLRIYFYTNTTVMKNIRPGVCLSGSFKGHTFSLVLILEPKHS